MDGPFREEEDRALVHPYAVLRSRDQNARVLQEETSGYHGTASLLWFLFPNSCIDVFSYFVWTQLD